MGLLYVKRVVVVLAEMEELCFVAELEIFIGSVCCMPVPPGAYNTHFKLIFLTLLQSIVLPSQPTQPVLS